MICYFARYLEMRVYFRALICRFCHASVTAFTTKQSHVVCWRYYIVGFLLSSSPCSASGEGIHTLLISSPLCYYHAAICRYHFSMIITPYCFLRFDFLSPLMPIHYCCYAIIAMALMMMLILIRHTLLSPLLLIHDIIFRLFIFAMMLMLTLMLLLCYTPAAGMYAIVAAAFHDASYAAFAVAAVTLMSCYAATRCHITRH